MFLEMHTRFLRLVITLVFALLSVALSKGQGAPVFHLEKEIPLTGVEGRIDHFSADVAGQRLFVAALGNGSVEVLDVREGKRTAEIRALKEPQGVFYDPKAWRLYVATGGDGKLHIYDGKSLTEQTTLEFGDDADNIRQDPQTGDLWVGYGNAGLGIVNSSGQNAGSVALGTHPESFQFEEEWRPRLRPGRRLVYIIGGEGAVEVLRQRDADNYERVGNITTAPGARTGLFVPAFGPLFVAAPHRGLQLARVLVYEVHGD
jgi:hypothetical protein